MQTGNKFSIVDRQNVIIIAECDIKYLEQCAFYP